MSELTLIFMAAAGVTFILLGLALRRLVREAPGATAPIRRRPRGRLPGTLLVIVGGLLLGAAATGTVIAVMGDPVGGYLASRTQQVAPSRPTELEGASGAQLYGILCSGCHGETGSKVSRANLSSPDYLIRHDKGSLAKAILEQGGDSHNFGSKGLALTEAEVGRLISYVRSLEAQPPQPTPTPTPDWSSLPGWEAFRSNCSCHATMPGRIVNPEVLRPYETSPRFHDYTGEVDSGKLSDIAQFLTSAKRVDPQGPFGGAVRHVDGWISKHPSFVKTKGAGLCFQCHQNAFCIRCHTARS